MLIGPEPPAAPQPGPPGREKGPEARRRGIPVPAPTAGFAGCDSAIRGRPRPTPAPREQLPRKMNIPPLPRPGPLAQSLPVVSAASQRRAGSLTPTLAQLPGGDAGGGGAPGRRRRGAELSTPGTSPHARPRMACPPRAPGRCPRARRAAPHKVTACSDGCTRPLLARARGQSPEPPLRPWSPSDSGPRGGALRAWRPKPPDGGGWGQWRRQALIGDTGPHARPLCGPEPPAPSRPAIGRWALRHGGCKLWAGGRTKGYPPGCGAAGGSCSRADGRKTTNEAEFLEQGHGSPSPPPQPAGCVAAALHIRPLGESQGGGRPPQRARGQPG